jgi:hypothetical protein
MAWDWKALVGGILKGAVPVVGDYLGDMISGEKKPAEAMAQKIVSAPFQTTGAPQQTGMPGASIAPAQPFKFGTDPLEEKKRRMAAMSLSGMPGGGMA